jgi:hypothetical protein
MTSNGPAAWPRIGALLSADPDDTSLFIAAIEAATAIRPQAAVERLSELTNSEDEDIADAACEALAMAEARAEFEDNADDDDERWR